MSRAVSQQIAATGLPVRQFLGKRGDVLLWHACLAHRGSLARVKGMPRRSLISHYSELEHRIDFPRDKHRTHATGGRYQEFNLPLY